MGGGSKKKSIAAAERAQSRAGSKEGEAKEEKKASEQKTGPRSVLVTDDLMKTIKKEALKTGTITPYTIASKYNLKISTAKEILRGLAADNLVRKAASNRRTIVYTLMPTKAEMKPEGPTPTQAGG
jgi:small subunit ribosomal protein S25e